jgi:hypothetical protein
MKRYAAEDSAFLLPLFVAMRRELLDAAAANAQLLTDAFNRCQALTLKVYEKDFARSVEAQMQESARWVGAFGSRRQLPSVCVPARAGCAQGAAGFDEHRRGSDDARPGGVEGSDGYRAQHAA